MYNLLDIQSVADVWILADVVRSCRSRWFVHLERMRLLGVGLQKNGGGRGERRQGQEEFGRMCEEGQEIAWSAA